MVPVNSMITFRPDQEINEVIDIIIEKRISGAPVLDENRKLVGIISEKDCLRIIVDQAYHNLPHIFSQGFRLYDKRSEDFVTGK